MTTAATVITTALRLYGIIDQTESPTPTDIANNVPILNDLLRQEHVDGACQYLIKRAIVPLPAGVAGSIYTFTVGAGASFTLNADAVAIRQIFVNDVSQYVNRETRMVPIVDVVRTTFPGMITKWHQERQSDGSILVTAWQPPRVQVSAVIEYGGRIGLLSATDGSDVVGLPPEGMHDAAMLLGRRIFGSYGRSAQAVAIVLADSERINNRWRDWARGQQWIRMVRA
jgi:hypothetical protein